VLKTSGEVQRRAYRFAYLSGVSTLVLIALVSLWTPFLDAAFMRRWFAWPQILFVAPVPLLVAVAAWVLFQGLRHRHEARPFLAALTLFVLCFVGLLISFFPYLVPTSVTLWEAAAPDTSLRFLLVGSAVLIPLIVGYSAYSYWVFRGKVDTAGGYH
jgi:cytochrome d ubiquinol oxidase subunit II